MVPLDGLALAIMYLKAKLSELKPPRKANAVRMKRADCKGHERGDSFVGESGTGCKGGNYSWVH